MDQQIFNQSNHESINTSLEAATAPIYAGFWRRFLAMIIDGFITGILGIILSFIIGNDIILTISISAIIGIIYVGIFDSSNLQATPGKALLGLAVVAKGSLEKITFKTAVIRFVLKYISGLMLCFGYLIQPFTEKKQTFHDIASETVVIKKNVGEINYFKVFKENFSRVLGN